MPRANLKILIDTGSTRSYVNSNIAKKLFPTKITKEEFFVKTAHGTSKGQFVTRIPCGELFQHNGLNLKFNVFNFHKKFDLLLGLDNLKIIKASIDLDNNTLKTPNVEIPLLYLNSNICNTNLIDGRSVQTIKIKIQNMKNGEAILPYIKIGKNLEIPESLITIKNQETFVKITNTGENSTKLIQTKPLVVEEVGDVIVNDDDNNLNTYFSHNFDFKFDMSKLRLNHMNEEEKAGITKLVSKYPDIFHLEDSQLTFTNQVKHKIRTTDDIPVYARNYRFPEIYRKEVDRQVQEMLDQGIVTHSESPWNAPIWIVPKKADASGKPKFRIVIDYRKLNEKTIEDKYPLPQISDLLDKLGRCRYFSIIDLKSGFHQIEMDPESREKTAFSTPNYHLEFNRMPFGLKNSPATFQRLMDNILRGIANEYCCVYLDDVIIFSTSLSEHLLRLEEVFKRLRKANLKIQLDKTEFLKHEIAYLGHTITPQGVKPNPDKIDAILKYPIPKTTKEIKAFLGLLGYYRRFIKDFAKVTKPFTRCLKKGSKIEPTDPEYVECFESCKKLLTNDPILQYPDFDKPFHLTTDASNVAIGAVLSQPSKNGDLPVAYASRTLNDSERRRSTIERELLAIVWGVEHFRPYLYGRKFKIFSDHRPLQWLSSIKEPSSKLFKWKTKLSAYDFEIEYKKGALNTNADALSRIELLNNNSDSEDPELKSALDDFFAACTPNTLKTINELPLQDETESVTANFDPTETLEIKDKLSVSDATAHSDVLGHAVVSIPIKDEPINSCNHQIFIEVIKTPVENPVLIKKVFDKNQRILVKLSQSNLENDIVKFVKEYVTPKIKYGIYFSNDIYEQFTHILNKHFSFSEINLTKYTKAIVDVEEISDQTEIIQKYHSGTTNHRGISETLEHLKRHYYWPNMKQSIQKIINNCEVCLICKYDRNPIKVKYNITPTASKPLEIVHVDKITLDNSKFLTIVDSFSKFAQVYPLKSSNSIELVKGLITYFSHHVIPSIIISDNGAEFHGSLIRELMEFYNIKIHYISSQHPDSNGVVERFHSTLIEHIRLLKSRKEFVNDTIQTKVCYAVIAYNASIHSTTKLSPCEILYGHIGNDGLIDAEIERTFTNNYLNQHKERIKLLYANINSRLADLKTKNITKLNENREEIPQIPHEVYVKTVQKQSKTLPKYNKEQIKSQNPELKTALIVPRHHNTKEKIHLSNVRRPKKFTDITEKAWDEKADKTEILISKFGLNLTRDDLLTLKNKNWLNDNIVNFYMELIDQRNRQNPNTPKTFCFSTFLFVSLVAGGYPRVKNFTRKTDIFEKDLVIIPIFKTSHWRLVVVKINSKEIVYLDSLNLDGSDILAQIKTYLVEEHRTKKGSHLNISEWKAFSLPDTPQQNNSYDCGAFMCHFAKTISNNEQIEIKPTDIPNLRELMCYEILKAELL